MLKRRRMMNDRLRLPDKDYMSYLEIKYHSHQVDTDDDPQYVLFLKKTKRKGKSYVTTFEETGVLMFVHYEKDGSCSDDLTDSRPIKVKKVGNGKCDTSSFKFAEKIARTEDGDYMRYLEIKYGSRQEGGSESGDSTYCNDDANDNVYDPQYVLFLSNTKQTGLSYVTTLEENGLRLCIHYEKEGIFGNEGNDNVSERKDSESIEVERLNVLRSGIGRLKEPKIEEQDINFEAFTPPCMEGKYVDQDYDLLLQVMQMQSEGYGASKDLSCDQDDSGDVEILEGDCATFCNGGKSQSCAPQVQYCEVGNTCEPVYKNEDSEFRQKVVSILKRPFEEAEYEKLLHEAAVQKPVEKNLELRHGRDRYCPSNRIGKSYFDHFDDLNKRIEQVGSNKCKMLNILRGFFFWLQNITHEGRFKPWNDPDCLDILPGF